MNTTTAPAATDADLIAALDASPDFVTVTDGEHLATLLGMQAPPVPSADALAVLNDKALASGRERGIVAAGVLERLVPGDVAIEEYNVGSCTRAVYLSQDDVDQVALHFQDRTTEVALYVYSNDPEEEFHGFVTPADAFDRIRAYYRL